MSRMTMEEGKILRLSICELQILLYKRKLSGLIIFDDVNMLVPDEKTIIGAMGSMIEDGILEPGKNDCFRLCDAVRHILDIMESAENILTIREKNNMVPQRCVYYRGEYAAVLTMDELNKNFVLLEEMGRSKAEQLLADAGKMEVDGEKVTIVKELYK